MYELAFCTELIKSAVFLSTIVASYVVYFYCFVCGVCVYVRVADRLVGVGCHLGLPSTLFFKTGFLSEFAGLAGQQSSRGPLVSVFSVWDYTHMVQRRTQVLMLRLRALDRQHLPRFSRSPGWLRATL